MSIQVLHDTRPTARKPHQCHSCARVIAKGEIYRRQDNVGDDGRFTWKACAHCDIVWDRIWATDPDLRFYADDGVDIHEYLIEHGPVEVLVQFERRWRNVDPESLRLLSWAPVECRKEHG